MLIRGLPVFEVPPTPQDPNLAVGTRLTAAGVLAMIAAVIGDQYGFKPELNGRIIQDIVPVPGFENTQQSISNETGLYTHIELAFTDYRPHCLPLFSLPGHHHNAARTMLS